MLIGESARLIYSSNGEIINGLFNNRMKINLSFLEIIFHFFQLYDLKIRFDGVY